MQGAWSRLRHGAKNITENRRTLSIAAGVCIVAATTFIILVFIGTSFNSKKDSPKQLSSVSSCPTDYADHPLLLISLDGFRADYLHHGLTPTLDELARTGVSTPYMVPSFPTDTFPNHYSIVTGFYPESHGIIDSKFYDPDFNASYNRKTKSSLEGRWYGGEPIWNTVQKQGKKSATFFWVGSEADIGGLRPNYYKKFDFLLPFEERVDQILQWVSLPTSDRPQWLSLYIQEPDFTGHRKGPDSPELKLQLTIVDDLLKRLIDGLKSRHINQCVNIIVASDHGMVASGSNKIIFLEDVLPDADEVLHFSPDSFTRFNIDNNNTALQHRVEKAFSCNHQLRLYRKEDLPKRLHYSNNNRINDYVFTFEEGVVSSIRVNESRRGEHGYDNLKHSMRALFIANGPDFKQGLVAEPFENIELYNMMCFLVGVNPSPNNGTKDALMYMLKDEPAISDSVEELVYPKELEFSERFELEEIYWESCYNGTNTTVEEILDSIHMNNVELINLKESSLPWGPPLESRQRPFQNKILYQPNYIIGYSPKFNAPIWTSFSIDSPVNLRNSSPSAPQWLPDPRVLESSNDCIGDFNDGLRRRRDDTPYTMMPLFNIDHFGNSSDALYLTSNALEVSDTLKERMTGFMHRISRWFQTQGPLNVLIGNVFDKNADSFFDGNAKPSDGISSDVFAIVLRCKEKVSKIGLCSPFHMDAMSFIFPQHQQINSCMSDNEFTLNFIATLRDVEKASGLSFFPSIPPFNKLRLRLRIHQKLWL